MGVRYQVMKLLIVDTNNSGKQQALNDLNVMGCSMGATHTGVVLCERFEIGHIL